MQVRLDARGCLTIVAPWQSCRRAGRAVARVSMSWARSMRSVSRSSEPHLLRDVAAVGAQAQAVEQQLSKWPAVGSAWYAECFLPSWERRFIRHYHVTHTDSNGNSHTSYYSSLESRCRAKPSIPWPFFIIPGQEQLVEHLVEQH